MIWIAGVLFALGWIHMFLAGRSPYADNQSNQVYDDVHLKTGVAMILISIVFGLAAWIGGCNA